MYNFLVCLLTLFPDLGPLPTYLFINLLVPYSTMQSFLHLAPCVETKNIVFTVFIITIPVCIIPVYYCYINCFASILTSYMSSVNIFINSST